MTSARRWWVRETGYPPPEGPVERWLRRAFLIAVPLLAALVLTGGFEPYGQPWADAAGAATAPGPGTRGGEPGTGGTAAAAGTVDDGIDGAGSGPLTDPPVRVRIPAIQVDSPLDPLALDATGALQAPTNFAHAGWYAGGTVPGDVGPAVIAGHIDNRAGPAVFFRLHQLTAGDEVQVQRGGRWLVFHVVSTARYPKNQFPTAEVYGPTPDAELRLITCGGSFNASIRSYVDNVVVYAVAAG